MKHPSKKNLPMQTKMMYNKQMLTFNYFDIFCLTMIIITGIFGFRRGFSREILSIGAAVLALILTNYFAPHLQNMITQTWPVQEIFAILISYFTIFFVSYFIFSYLVKKITKILHETEFKSIDKTFGILIGAIKGLVICCLIYLLIVWLVPIKKQRPEWFNDATSTPFLKLTSITLEKLFIPNARTKILQREEGDKLDLLNNDDAYELLIKPGIKETEEKKDDTGYTKKEREGLEKILFQINN